LPFVISSIYPKCRAELRERAQAMNPVDARTATMVPWCQRRLSFYGSMRLTGHEP
jgi:hypothetical protein